MRLQLLKADVARNERPANLCGNCTIHQDCCTNLSGLRVTQAEFQRCFARHSERLNIVREGSVYAITPRNGAGCPNWENGGCAVYEVRPRECRLFPYTLFVREQRKEFVSIGYHSHTRCPLKNALLSSDANARQTVIDFGTEAFPGATLAVRKQSAVEVHLRKGLSSILRLLSGVREVVRGRTAELSAGGQKAAIGLADIK